MQFNHFNHFSGARPADPPSLPRRLNSVNRGVPTLLLLAGIAARSPQLRKQPTSREKQGSRIVEPAKGASLSARAMVEALANRNPVPPLPVNATSRLLARNTIGRNTKGSGRQSPCWLITPNMPGPRWSDTSMTSDTALPPRHRRASHTTLPWATSAVALLREPGRGVFPEPASVNNDCRRPAQLAGGCTGQEEAQVVVREAEQEASLRTAS